MLFYLKKAFLCKLKKEKKKVKKMVKKFVLRNAQLLGNSKSQKDFFSRFNNHPCQGVVTDNENGTVTVRFVNMSTNRKNGILHGFFPEKLPNNKVRYTKGLEYTCSKQEYKIFEAQCMDTTSNNAKNLIDEMNNILPKFPSKDWRYLNVDELRNLNEVDLKFQKLLQKKADFLLDPVLKDLFVPVKQQHTLPLLDDLYRTLQKKEELSPLSHELIASILDVRKNISKKLDVNYNKNSRIVLPDKESVFKVEQIKQEIERMSKTRGKIGSLGYVQWGDEKT
jgi:hypothetical protein